MRRTNVMADPDMEIYEQPELAAQAATIAVLQRMVDEREKTTQELREDMRTLTETVAKLSSTVTELVFYMNAFKGGEIEKRVRALENWALTAKVAGIAFAFVVSTLIYWISSLWSLIDRIKGVGH